MENGVKKSILPIDGLVFDQSVATFVVIGDMQTISKLPPRISRLRDWEKNLHGTPSTHPWGLYRSHPGCGTPLQMLFPDPSSSLLNFKGNFKLFYIMFTRQKHIIALCLQ